MFTTLLVILFCVLVHVVCKHAYMYIKLAGFLPLNSHSKGNAINGQKSFQILPSLSLSCAIKCVYMYRWVQE